MKYELTHATIEKVTLAIRQMIADKDSKLGELYAELEDNNDRLKKEICHTLYQNRQNHIKDIQNQIKAISKETNELYPVLAELEAIYEADRVKPFYFTFGDSPTYPFKADQYVIVRARSINGAAYMFKKFHPNYDDPFVLNCADYYSERAWNTEVHRYYMVDGLIKEPAEVIDFTGEVEALEGRAYGNC